VHERLVVVRVAPGVAELLAARAGPDPGGAGGEDAPGHRGEGRREGQRDRLARGQREILRDLGGMPVTAAHAVRRHRAHHLRAEQVGFKPPARAGRAAGRDNDDVVGLQQSGDEPRGEGEGAGRRVAARDGDPGGAFQLVADDGAADRHLGQTVRPRPGVGGSVERLPRLGVGQPVVGAAVDDHRVVRKPGCELGGRAVRQREERDVVAEQRVGRGRFEDPVTHGGEMRVDVAEPPPSLGVRGDRTELDVGVTQEEPDDLTPGVPARTGDCCHNHAA
jgi:hypothetical protein